MIPIISLVGRSGSGKTTFLEKIIPEMKRRGYRIATVKHDTHDFEIDREGKDSFRHKKAGAVISIISSPKKVALTADTEHELSLAELRKRFVRSADLIFSEGYYRDIHPKIEVFRKGVHPKPLCGKGDNLIAYVSNVFIKRGVPCFGLDDIKGVADFIEERFLKR